MITLQIKSNIRKRLQEAQAETLKGVGFAVEASAKALVNDARRFAPKDTSRLARGHTAERVGARRWRAFTNVEYARYQNDGFRGIQYVRPHHRLQTHYFGRKVSSPQRVQVRRHHRKVNYRGTGYFDRAVRRQTPRFNVRLRQALRQNWN